MNELINALRQQFPAEFEVSSNGELISIRDSNQPREQGFRITVEEDIQQVRATLKFEDFAAPLMQISAERIISGKNSATEMLSRNKRLSISRNRIITERLFTSEPGSEPFWWLTIDYRKNGWEHQDMLEYSDALIYWIFFLFPYIIEGEPEGETSEKNSSFYERSRANRSICLALHGYSCSACGLNMKAHYGIDRDYIHVHHIMPVSVSGKRRFDPFTDLIPLCPNCHAVAHLKNPPYTVAEIKLMLTTNDTI